MYRRWQVRWKFGGELDARISVVLARDAMHARERVWMTHVEIGALRRRIDFLSVRELDDGGEVEEAG